MDIEPRKRGRPRKNKIIPTDNLLTDNSAVLDKTLDIDRVASVEQKEQAIADAGITRLKVYKKINELIHATKVVETIIDGEVVKTEVPDVPANTKGCELMLKAFNDSKEFDRAVGGVTHNKVVYQWLQVNNSGAVPTRITDE